MKQRKHYLGECWQKIVQSTSRNVLMYKLTYKFKTLFVHSKRIKYNVKDYQCTLHKTSNVKNLKNLFILKTNNTLEGKGSDQKSW